MSRCQPVPVGDEKIRRPISRVLCRPSKGTRRSFLWTDPCGPVLATYPEPSSRRRLYPPRPKRRRARDPYSVLLLAGLAMRPLSPAARCALTAPFHPSLRFRTEVRSEGGLLSVALSLGLPPVGVTHRHVVVEPGLSSTSLRRPRPPGRLIRAETGRHGRPGQAPSRNSAINRARVSPSARPSTRSGRQWRWNARTTAAVSASNWPDGGRS